MTEVVRRCRLWQACCWLSHLQCYRMSIPCLKLCAVVPGCTASTGKCPHTRFSTLSHVHPLTSPSCHFATLSYFQTRSSAKFYLAKISLFQAPTIFVRPLTFPKYLHTRFSHFPTHFPPTIHPLVLTSRPLSTYSSALSLFHPLTFSGRVP